MSSLDIILPRFYVESSYKNKNYNSIHIPHKLTFVNSVFRFAEGEKTFAENGLISEILVILDFGGA